MAEGARKDNEPKEDGDVEKFEFGGERGVPFYGCGVRAG